MDYGATEIFVLTDCNTSTTQIDCTMPTTVDIRMPKRVFSTVELAQRILVLKPHLNCK